MGSPVLNDTSLSPSKQIKNTKRKTYPQLHHHRNYHQHQLHHHYQYRAAQLPNILRQSSCGNNMLLHQKFASPAPPPNVQLDMVHATKGSVFFNHLPNNIHNQTSLYSSLPPTMPSHHHHHLNHHQLPLLPLPTFHSLPVLTRNSSLSSQSPKKQSNKKSLKTPAPSTNKKSSTTARKNMNKKENTCNNNNGSLLSKDDRAAGSTEGVGPDSVKEMEDLKKENGDEKEDFVIPFSIFCLAPPPSSLPLPKFSLRQVQQNFNCKAEAAFDEVDVGAAADNLCRLLKLR